MVSILGIGWSTLLGGLMDVDLTAIVVALIGMVSGSITGILAVKRNWFGLQNRLNMSASEALAVQNATHTDQMYKRATEQNEDIERLQEEVKSAATRAAACLSEAEAFRSSVESLLGLLKSGLSGDNVSMDSVIICRNAIETWLRTNKRRVLRDAILEKLAESK